MGEKSKRSGEIGEALASALLEMIGWSPSICNLPIPCNTQTHVNENGNPRTTHGEDQIFLYHNPFHDERSEIVHVSVKNVGKYPAEGTLKTKFKAHIKELHETIECAKHSRELQQISTTFGARRHKHHSGLLVWLHNDEEEIEQDIKPALANVRLEQTNDVPIYLVDNARASFLLKVIDDLKLRSQVGKVEFFYPNIGTSVGVEEERRGTTIPLELVAADIIPGVIRSAGRVELIVYAHQSFSIDAYKKLIAYAFQFGTGLVFVSKIGMLDYNPASHENDAKQARLAFSSRTESITPFNFNRSILNLLEGVTE
jgi:hypothetical protein